MCFCMPCARQSLLPSTPACRDAHAQQSFMSLHMQLMQPMSRWALTESTPDGAFEPRMCDSVLPASSS
jgi:hypothetical protein